MPRTRIKICGICSPEDARLAASRGADAVGIVLHPSARRHVDPDAARDIVRALPPFVTPVALFVDQNPQTVARTAAHVGVTHVQLHGDEDPDLLASLPDHLRVIKALRADPATLGPQLDRWAAATPRLAGIVLDTPHAAAPGGTGVENDWDTIRNALGTRPNLPPIIAAGGLRPDNVAAVVRLLRPYAVDVSSGVEGSLRHKSPDKIKAFIDNVQTALNAEG